MCQQTTLKQAKKGEYIRLTTGAAGPVWVRGEYDRSTGLYEMFRADDINRSIYRKGTQKVFIGFTY